MFGGSLTALVLPDFELISVKAREHHRRRHVKDDAHLGRQNPRAYGQDPGAVRSFEPDLRHLPAVEPEDLCQNLLALAQGDLLSMTVEGSQALALGEGQALRPARSLSWSTVRRAEEYAIARWEIERSKPPLRYVGVDEKYLGRRHRREEKFVTIVSNLETGEPVWMGYGRSEATLKQWLDTLTPKQKKRIRLFAMDMHEAFKNAVANDRLLRHVAIVHDPFHVMKRANAAIDELRRQIFFRAGPDMRSVGRGTRWLFLRAWERCTLLEQIKLRQLLACNAKLAAAYQLKEELREVLAAPDESAMAKGMTHVLRRTQRKANVPLRKLHDSLVNHLPQILALGKHRPPVGRIEALNNNWETLVRRGRGYRDHPVPPSQAPLPHRPSARYGQRRPSVPLSGRLTAPFALPANETRAVRSAPRCLTPTPRRTELLASRGGRSAPSQSVTCYTSTARGEQRPPMKRIPRRSRRSLGASRIRAKSRIFIVEDFR